MTDKEEIVEVILNAIGELKIEMKAQADRLSHVETQITELRSELKTEVKRWDDRFFEFAKESANRANTFIGSAAIAVIGGVVLLILRMS